MIRYMIQESISVIRIPLIPTDRDIVRENLPLSLYIYRYTFDAVIKDSVLKERKSTRKPKFPEPSLITEPTAILRGVSFTDV